MLKLKLLLFKQAQVVDFRATNGKAKPHFRTTDFSFPMQPKLQIFIFLHHVTLSSAAGFKLPFCITMSVANANKRNLKTVQHAKRASCNALLRINLFKMDLRETGRKKKTIT